MEVKSRKLDTGEKFTNDGNRRMDCIYNYLCREELNREYNLDDVNHVRIIVTDEEPEDEEYYCIRVFLRYDGTVSSFSYKYSQHVRYKSEGSFANLDKWLEKNGINESLKVYYAWLEWVD